MQRAANLFWQPVTFVILTYKFLVMILKDFIYQDIRRKPLVTQLADLNNCTEQAIRLWSRQKSDLITKYKNLLMLCEHYQCMIPDLFQDSNTEVQVIDKTEQSINDYIDNSEQSVNHYR